MSLGSFDYVWDLPFDSLINPATSIKWFPDCVVEVGYGKKTSLTPNLTPTL